LPHHAVLVSDIELRIGTVQILLNKRKWPARLVLRASRSVQQIARTDIGGLPPEDRGDAMAEFGDSRLPGGWWSLVCRNSDDDNHAEQEGCYRTEKTVLSCGALG